MLGSAGCTATKRYSKLEYFDTVDALKENASFILFFSHEWVGVQHPDPDNVQYPLMVQALSSIVEARGWPVEKVRVWLDYHSVPQANSSCKQLAIGSIFLYASESDAFCAVTPIATRPSGKSLDTQSYLKRLWCRAELLLFWLKNSQERLYLATDDGTLTDGQPTPGKPHIRVIPNALIEQGECLKVFEGEATVDSDKLLLVLPFLGIYGALLKQSVKHNAAKRQQQSRAMETGPCDSQSPDEEMRVANSSHEEDATKSFKVKRELDQRQQQVLQRMLHDRDTIFPPNSCYVPRMARCNRLHSSATCASGWS